MPKSDFVALPNAQGIYYFLNQKKEIVYIGKAKDIKKRVHSHFSGNSNSRSKNGFVKNVFGVDFQLIPNNLLLDIIEATEIKKHWPRYNRSMKRFSLNYGLFLYEDRNGYLRLSIGRSGKHDKPIQSFQNQEILKRHLKNMVLEHELCPRLAGLQPISHGKCNYIEDFECKGACEQKEKAEVYNARLKIALDGGLQKEATYILKEEDQLRGEQAIILVEKGRYKGYTTLPLGADIQNVANIKKQMTAAYDDQDLSHLVQAYLQKAKAEDVVYF